MQWIRRLGSPRSGFRYVTAGGTLVRKQAVLDRIAALRVPPAYRDVHIAVDARAAVQAWGVDARGRKQYRYHARAVEQGQLRKYHRIAGLARDLHVIRAAIARDSGAAGLPKEKVSAGVVRLLSEGYLRVGSDRYARDNHTYGATTFLKRHATVADDCAIFHYVGKRAIYQRQVVVDRRLAGFVAALQRTPGRRLFRYQENGVSYDLSAKDVNAYLRHLVGVPYTAKDFRTWGGTLRAAMVLAELGQPSSKRDATRNIATAIRIVAAELGNTPAICRKSYVHPMVLAQYLDRGVTIESYLPAPRRGRAAQSGAGGKRTWAARSPEERALIAFLAEHFPERRRRPREAAAA